MLPNHAIQNKNKTKQKNAWNNTKWKKKRKICKFHDESKIVSEYVEHVAVSLITPSKALAIKPKIEYDGKCAAEKSDRL